MKLRKKYLVIITLLIAGLNLITSDGASVAQQNATVLTAQTAEGKTNRLFGDMGIIRVPRTGPPVEISLLDVNGRMVRVSDFRGKIVFLNFWTTWCAECRIEMPSLEALHQKLKDNIFVMVSINLQEPAELVKKFFQDKKLTFTALLDSNGDVGRQFAVRSIPVTFILDQEGKIIGKAFGSRKWNSRKSIALFEHLINNTAQNENNNKHPQKKSISSHFIQSDTGTGNPGVHPAFAG
jgi:thiol-disulfide isomerase/thioredoxin